MALKDAVGVAGVASECVDDILWVTGKGADGVLASVRVLGAGAFGGSSSFFFLLFSSDPRPLVIGFFIGVRCGVLGGLFVVVLGGFSGIGVFFLSFWYYPLPQAVALSRPSFESRPLQRGRLPSTITII